MTHFAMLTLRDAETLINDPKTAKQTLVAIARERFSCPPSRCSLSKQKLRDHLETLARNERSHETIARMAKK